MREYELIREIPNCCKNNQMRDVFFEEVSCDDPVAYVQALLPQATLTTAPEMHLKIIVFAQILFRLNLSNKCVTMHLYRYKMVYILVDINNISCTNLICRQAMITGGS